eukprot:CCRYP_019471-RA/>CCRYP_019471-RA protein AED:0.40 eAED:0.78 QI:0/-1/0/1/-1/0/1/0/72
MSLHDIIPIMMLLEEMKKKGFKSFAPTLMSTARSLRTTLEHWSWHAYPSFALAPSTSIAVTIILGSLPAKAC